MARSLTVNTLLLQSTTHCRYRVYTKFLLTYTAIYRGNRKVLPLGITALQPQSHFHLGTPYTLGHKLFRTLDNSTGLPTQICGLYTCHEVASLSSRIFLVKDKDKAIPLQAWTGPEDSRNLRLPDFKTIGT